VAALPGGAPPGLRIPPCLLLEAATGRAMESAATSSAAYLPRSESIPDRHPHPHPPTLPRLARLARTT
jgi:hypothetical protein